MLSSKAEVEAKGQSSRLKFGTYYPFSRAMDTASDWLSLRLRPIQHKRGHFGDVPQANLLAWYGKLNLTQQKHAFTNQKECTTAHNKHKQELSSSWDGRPWPQ